MYVALHGDEFRLVVLIDDRWCAGGLGLVPFAIDFGKWMNVVRGLVVIDDLKLLIHLERKDVRNILAAFLVEGCCLTRRGVVGSAGGDVYDDIFEAVVRASDNRFRRYWSGVLLGAARLLGHIDGLRLCGSSFVGGFSADRAAASAGVQQLGGENQRDRSDG